ncbi:Kae1-like domain-containing protein [Phytomonospora endophytica]|uniref:Hydrogenase maturation protein HypF n=1 Tax=Phytomonospora endophytica TaxID=714109 RepID=A0A841FRH7_9ACTN|nr:Sua5/YciO/YrdC/YwlC family protein [Phytomonospora endophytica]MBB6038414.1 hydrogenase maturation protein HypF [Phytomonospora endophytica]GIG64344.1 hypothetical protein Pen01_06390 [Phytomonospora endophytica]
MVGSGAGAHRLRADIEISGVPQGVGFHPYVYRLARACRVDGDVSNVDGNVLIRASGTRSAVEEFLFRLSRQSPATPVSIRSRLVDGELPQGFTIGLDHGGRREVSDDRAVCEACLADLWDPYDRRFGYPFTNCADCGPRASILTGVDWDRRNTTMESFRLCSGCAAEHADPSGRRYHAEPVGCPKCGPRLTWTARASTVEKAAPALDGAVAALDDGGVVAVKSVGGYRLFADAADIGALARLRDFDPRPPALLMPDVDTADALIGITDGERALLQGTDAPIVLVSTVHSAVGDVIAPGVGEVGVQLPHTPLLHLIAAALDRPLAFITGPRPITDDDEAASVLGLVADGILAHDQRIAMAVDDAVVRADPGGVTRLQRAGRGHRPRVNGQRPTGTEPVQRHHAQVVATAAEHDVPGPFLGVAYDALGPGGDGTYWGGEVLLAGYTDFMRVGRFAHAPLPGGEAALDHPARLALGYLFGLESLGGQAIDPELTAPLLARFEPSLIAEVRRSVDGSSRASSAGMLCEAMAAVLGVHDVNSYRGEGSRLLAGTVGPDDGDAPALPWRLVRRDGLWVYDPAPTITGALTALAERVPVGRIAAAFESTLIEVTLAMIADVARRTMIQAVCLGGSVFGHRRLALRMLDALTEQGFGAFLNSATAPGQDTVDYGRDAVADARDRRERR